METATQRCQEHLCVNVQDAEVICKRRLSLTLTFYAEQWADALHQWLGITDDCVHMVAKVRAMSSESSKSYSGWSKRFVESGKSKHASDSLMQNNKQKTCSQAKRNFGI